jgi:hypothetical protein
LQQNEPQNFIDKVSSESINKNAAVALENPGFPQKLMNSPYEFIRVLG